MPLWTIYHTPGIFTAEDKRRLATAVADGYQDAGLPRFYVITLFSEVEADNCYVGGEQMTSGVRVVIEHIARHTADTAERQRIAHWIKDLLDPYIGGRAELHWEFHVDETSEDLWMINGVIPPPALSDAERAWAKANSASPY